MCEDARIFIKDFEVSDRLIGEIFYDDDRFHLISKLEVRWIRCDVLFFDIKNILGHKW